MMVDDEVQAAIAGYIAQQDEIIAADVSVFQGWVNNDTFTVPSVTVSIQNGQFSAKREVFNRDYIDANTMAIVWLRGYWQLPVRLDLYTRTKRERRDLFSALRQSLVGGMDDQNEPKPGGLELQMPHYENAKIRVLVQDARTDDREVIGDGYYRQSIDLTVRAPELRRVEYTRAQYAAVIHASHSLEDN